MSSTMTFKLRGNEGLSLVKKSDEKLYTKVRFEKRGLLSKLSDNSKTNKIYSVAPISMAMAATAAGEVTGGTGIFWNAFMDYIFPYMLDIAKVFCAIKIAQGFYMEKRGGREEGTGFGALVTYGKWLIVFNLIPWGVELVDQLGAKMISDLRK